VRDIIYKFIKSMYAMVDNPDTVEFRKIVLRIGFDKGFEVNTEVPIPLDGKLQPVDIVFEKGEIKHFIEIESGGKSGTSYDPKGRRRDVRIVAQANKGFILTKNDRGKRLHKTTLDELNVQGLFNNVEILTWEEYKSLALSNSCPH